MAEQIDIQRMIVAAACSAAGPLTNEVAWKAKVADIIPQIAAMVRDEGSPAMRLAGEVLGATMFTATYRGYDYEESSTRCLVHIVNDKGEIERDLRTKRTNTRAGKVAQLRLDQLQPGDRILVYKNLESTKDPNKKVRVLVHFDRLRPASAVESPPAVPDALSVSPAGEPVRSSPEPETPVTPGGDFTEILNRMSAKDVAQVAAQARGEGIPFPMTETPQQRHRLEQIIDGVTHAF